MATVKDHFLLGVRWLGVLYGLGVRDTRPGVPLCFAGNPCGPIVWPHIKCKNDRVVEL